MFVSLKNRVIVGIVCAFLTPLTACVSNSPQEVPSPPAETTSAIVTSPSPVAPTEVMYDARLNWPNIEHEGVLDYKNGNRLCVETVACVQEEAAVLSAAQFVGNAFSKGMSFPDEISETDLKKWRDVAVVNVCFVNTWEAYVGGALLFFAYQDDATVSDYARAMNRFDMCKNADVLQQPQP